MDGENAKIEGTGFTVENNPLFWILILALLLYLLFSQLIANVRLPKKALVNVYGVDKKSFNKWVVYFCQDIVPDMKVYKRKRTVSLSEYLRFTQRFGSPVDHPILGKKEIVERGEGTYRSLRESVQRYPLAFGLPSYSAFKNIQKFPPNISKQILKQYG